MGLSRLRGGPRCVRIGLPANGAEGPARSPLRKAPTECSGPATPSAAMKIDLLSLLWGRRRQFHPLEVDAGHIQVALAWLWVVTEKGVLLTLERPRACQSNISGNSSPMAVKSLPSGL